MGTHGDLPRRAARLTAGDALMVLRLRGDFGSTSEFTVSQQTASAQTMRCRFSALEMTEMRRFCSLAL